MEWEDHFDEITDRLWDKDEPDQGGRTRSCAPSFVW